MATRTRTNPSKTTDAVFEEFVRQYSASPPASGASPFYCDIVGNSGQAQPALTRSEFPAAGQLDAALRPQRPPKQRRLQTGKPGAAGCNGASTTATEAGASIKPLLLPTAQAADFLALSTTTFQRLVRQGRLPKPRLLSDRRVAWFVEDLERYARSLPEANLLPPPNTGWGPRGRVKPALSGPSASWPQRGAHISTTPDAGVNGATQTTLRTSVSQRDRTGKRPTAGAVYCIPGTDVTWHRQYDYGAVKKEFSAAIHEGGHTWAEMELHGATKFDALAKLKRR